MDRDQDKFYDEEFDKREAPARPAIDDEQDIQSPPSEMETDDDHEYLMKLLDYLEGAMEGGSVVPLTGKRLVDANMCIDIIKDIRGNLPLAVLYAQQVMQDRDRILSDAQRTAKNKLASADSRANAAIEEADTHARQILNEAEDRANQIIKTAEIHARGLVDQHAIKISAQNEARDIVNEARADANDKRQAAGDYCDDLHHDTEKALQTALDIVRSHRQQLRK